MLGLILAGGQGTRYGEGEKPLALCGGRPMIERVADALDGAGLEVVVVASPCTPFTQNWCRAHDLLCVCTEGKGYVEDLVEAADLLGLDEPVLCVSADLPCLTAELVGEVVAAYEAQALPALSVWVPVEDENNVNAPCIEEVDGRRAVPAGINVLDGGRMNGAQEETRLLLDDPRLRHNVNTPDALKAAEAFLASAESPQASDCNHRKKDIDRSTR
ncbi:MAG: NTP transferase domain-containing protein [Methanospirillum sp.]